MAERVFFLNRLRDGVSAADYERWIREVDYPFARSLKTIESYVVTRLTRTLDGNPPPWGYLEVVEITDVAAYRAELAAGPAMEAFAREWSSFVGESIAVAGEVIE
jgi:hypothetical protein